MLLLHLPPDPGRGSGKRDAVLREETDGAGGLQPRPRLAGLLADHVQPGSDAAREGNGSMQRSGFGRVEMPDEEHPPVGAGGGERQGMSDAETAMVFDQGTGGTLQLHAQ